MIPFLSKSEGSLRLERGKVDEDKTVFPGGVKLNKLLGNKYSSLMIEGNISSPL